MTMVILSMVINPCRQAVAQNWDLLVEANHPRLFVTDDQLARVKAEEQGVVRELHELALSRAEVAVCDTLPISYSFTSDGKRLLQTAREAQNRILLCSYAYRASGDRRFLDHALRDLGTVCSFPSWNATEHFLDAAEMALAVGVGYDWLYKDIPDGLKEKIVSALDRNAFKPALDEDAAWFYWTASNWNQVCNGGLVSAALAVYEACDTVSKRVVSDAMVSNSRAVSGIYLPGGSYPEGPGYWNYGNVFQALMNTALIQCLEMNPEIEKDEAFLETARYKQFTNRGLGGIFNYSDNKNETIPAYAMWYFAQLCSKPEYAYREKDILKSGRYFETEESRLLPLIMGWVLGTEQLVAVGDSHGGRKALTGDLSGDGMYCSKGRGGVVMIKGRTRNMENFYLGIKGGSPVNNHSHLDGGSFVYDAYGRSWSVDPDRQEYSVIEALCASKGGDFWDMSQNSVRWNLLRMNNMGHSTLTINEALHYYKGNADITDASDMGGEWNADIDLTDLFHGEVSSVERSFSIDRRAQLRVCDVITATDTTDAIVRWNLVTPARVSLRRRGIILDNDGVRLYLRTKGMGAKVQYRIFSSDPADYGTVTGTQEPKLEGLTLCGFESLVSKKKTAEFTTVFKKIRY